MNKLLVYNVTQRLGQDFINILQEVPVRFIHHYIVGGTVRYKSITVIWPTYFTVQKPVVFKYDCNVLS